MFFLQLIYLNKFNKPFNNITKINQETPQNFFEYFNSLNASKYVFFTPLFED